MNLNKVWNCLLTQLQKKTITNRETDSTINLSYSVRYKQQGPNIVFDLPVSMATQEKLTDEL